WGVWKDAATRILDAGQAGDAGATRAFNRDLKPLANAVQVAIVDETEYNIASGNARIVHGVNQLDSALRLGMIAAALCTGVAVLVI
ncbi:hypothetical protein, partial [Enterococcus faecalis]|uniref:hypothetical protein n=1 Tax=Enterococcus faecalis TaxID=1351 RepID=UPI00403F0419